MNRRFILKQAARYYQHGGLIAYPTESVYGLGCDPLNPHAVEYLLQLKNRPVEKGLILLSDSIQKLLPFIDISAQQQAIINQPQAITWLVKPSPLTPLWVKGQYPKVAVRITHHPVARQLCAALTAPIISTSANPAQRPPARNSLQLRQYFKQDIDCIVAGKTGGLKRPTQIIDIDSRQIYRN